MKRHNVLIILLSALLMLACSQASQADTATTGSDNQEQKNPTKKKKPAQMTKVLLKTSMGDIVIALYDETPLHKENFIKLVNDKYYDGVLFHRIIQNFMIQTGDPESKAAKPGQMLGNGGPGYTIPAEFVPGLYHKRGAVAAARMGDNVNPKKESSGSQFYIVDGRVFSTNDLNRVIQMTGKTYSMEQIKDYTSIGGAPHLDGDYTVFGEVVSGMEIVDKIAAQQKDGRDRPLEDIKIISAEIMTK
ncbi:MAG: peptidylprolyl isomerase [Bacteroidales bacterium]|nr:peptidylprolyl isomerase [Bacteroidales bacterium]